MSYCTRLHRDDVCFIRTSNLANLVRRTTRRQHGDPCYTCFGVNAHVRIGNFTPIANMKLCSDSVHQRWRVLKRFSKPQTLDI